MHTYSGEQSVHYLLFILIIPRPQVLNILFDDITVASISFIHHSPN